jgi:hypothetical protein
MDVPEGMWIDPAHNCAYSELPIDQGGAIQSRSGVKE